MKWCLSLFLVIQLIELSGTHAEVAHPKPTLLVPEWHGKTVRDLHLEYRNIFLKGNRNAASHLWSSFLLNRSALMEPERLEYMFSGFCAVSGSPVRPQQYTRYRMAIDSVSGEGAVEGYTYFCCWPCVCDTQDFIKVDTKTVHTVAGPRKYHWLVVGSPCTSPAHIPAEAPEVRCGEHGELTGAAMSDHGYVIITMFPLVSEVGELDAQAETEFADDCESRKQMGYNSGMGEIFRQVAGINPIQPGQLELSGAANGNCIGKDTTTCV